MEVQVVTSIQCECAENPLWDECNCAFYWTDIPAGRIYHLDPRDSSMRTYEFGEPVGSFAMRRQGGMIVAMASGFAFFDPATGAIQPIANPEAKITGNRFNDGKACPKGHFWAGTLATSLAPGAGSLYRLSTEGKVRKIMGGLTISNGMGWSPDHRTMYFIDSKPGTVYAFDYDDETGDVTNRRVIWKVPDAFGLPDGMTVDTEGMLWIAFYNGSCVRRWNPHTHEIMETISLPTKQITSCVFGGPNMNVLYITSASEDFTPEQRAADPMAGRIFAVEVHHRGKPLFHYEG